MSKITHLVTHSGSFHADEVCAYALLSRIFPDAELVRTRDEALIEELAPHAITFDVGGIYDHHKNRYDHHQPGRKMRADGKVPYSSFGLVWQEFAWTYLCTHHQQTAADAYAIRALLDGTFVRDIDAVDNGTIEDGQEALLHPASLPALICDQRPDFDDDDPASEEAAFLRAAELARAVIDAKIRNAAAGMRSDQLVAEAINNRKDPRWIELPRGLPFDAVIHAAGKDEILFVVAPVRGEWQVNIVPAVLGKYAARKDLPAAWAGLRGADLAAASGVDDAVFCHIARFIAVAKTREGAMQLLKIALDTPA